MSSEKVLDPTPRCIFLATNFPPIIGGSATVYEAFAAGMQPRQCAVIATTHHYENQTEIKGWPEYDAKAPFIVKRIKYMRPLERIGHRSLFRKVADVCFSDIPIQLTALITLVRTIRQLKAEILVVGELRAGGLLGRLARQLTGVKLVFFIHGEELSTQFNSRVYGKNSFKNLKKSDAVITVSSFTQSLLCNVVGVDAGKVHLIPNGVNTEKFSPASVPTNLNSSGRFSKRQVVLSLGRLVPRKGFDYCIEAWPQVISAVPSAHYLIVGEGPYRETLKQRVIDLGLQDSITFHGRADDSEVLDLYRMSTCFAMPNRTMPDGDTEGFGLVFLEANACGKAVIAGNAGGAPDAVTHLNNGLLVDGNSVDQIANAMILLLTDTDLRLKIESNALIRAEHSSWKARIADLQNVFINELSS
jgi:phosphatidyl-myo-inositol dimannoside synthase